MFIERLREFIEAKGLSIAGFEKTAGLSNASISKVLKQGSTIGVDKLENILRAYPELNPTWLLTGKGDMLLTEDFEGFFKNVPRADILKMAKAWLELMDAKARRDKMMSEMQELYEEVRNK